MRLARLACPACNSRALDLAFTRADWSEYAQTQTDVRRGYAEAMDANPALAFDNMQRCQICATVFTDFVPDLESLNGFYQNYHGSTGYLAKTAAKVALNTRRIFALKLLTRGRRFIDVGCNVGCAVEAARRNGFTATGLELDATAIAHAKSLFPQNRFLTGSVDAAPPGEVFDLVYCTEVVEHVPDVPAFIANLAALLAPRGILSLTCPEARPPASLLRSSEIKPPEHLTFFSRRGIKIALAPYFKHVLVLPSLKPGIQVVAFKA